ncbi:hypothetical protein [Natrinema soli]|uniref:Uncharacterized protein n=1 Tax=Natrinema soli TaxID=1930624 RepID=A0ABD5SNC5_9EURY|nr:hypothetical protein [Natrinema soli]
MKLKTEGITADGVDVEVSITVEGEEEAAETVHMQAHDEIAKALQAIQNGSVPSECDGMPWSVGFERRVESLEESE